MICPYCSTDMEPIELGGKTFCSNCGMTIKTSAPLSVNNQIQPINHGGSNTNPNSFPLVENNSDEALDNAKIENLNNSISDVKPVSNLTSEDILNKTTQQIAEEAVEDSQQEIAEETISQLTQIPTSAPIETTPPQAPSMPPVEQKTPKTLLSILNDDIEGIGSLSDEELKPLDVKPDEQFAQKVKDVEELAGAGILLDILSDEALTKSNEAQTQSLDVATNLIDKLHFPQQEIPEMPKATGDSEFKPMGGKKLKVATIEPSFDPIAQPEIEAPAEELDLSLPEKLLPENEPTSETPELSNTKAQEIEEIFNTPIPETDKIPFKVEVEETEESIEADNEIPVAPDTHILSSEEIESAMSEEGPKDPTETKTEGTPTETDELLEIDNNKSIHVKNYFADVITKESKKAKKKKSKKQVKKIKITIFIIIAIFTVLVASALALYFYETNKEQKQVAIEKVSAQNEENAILPIEVPFGYEKGLTVKDNDNDSYTTEYVFSADTTRKLVLKEEISENPTEKLAGYVVTQTSDFEVKTIDETEYTIFKNGSIAWTTKDKLFTITAIGTTFNDLVLKMAESMEKL